MTEPRVLIIAPRFDEPADDRAEVARILARTYADGGISTAVICPAGAARPSVEVSSRLEIRRLSQPRPDESGFIVRAIAAAHEIERRHPLAAIECIDSSRTLIAAKFAAAAGLLAAPIIHIRVSAGRGDADTVADALADAVHTLDRRFTEREDAEAIRLPSSSRSWRSPTAEGPVFAIPTELARVSHAEVAQAFALSKAAEEGWLLAALGAAGRWVLSAQARPSEGPRDCVVLLGCDPNVFPAVGLRAIDAGCLALIDARSQLASTISNELRSALVYSGPQGLADAMRALSKAESAQRAEWARALRAAVMAITAEKLLATRRALWRSLRTRVDPHTLESVWRLAEGDATTSLAPQWLETSR